MWTDFVSILVEIKISHCRVYEMFSSWQNSTVGREGSVGVVDGCVSGCVGGDSTMTGVFIARRCCRYL